MSAAWSLSTCTRYPNEAPDLAAFTVARLLRADPCALSTIAGQVPLLTPALNRSPWILMPLKRVALVGSPSMMQVSFITQVIVAPDAETVMLEARIESLA